MDFIKKLPHESKPKFLKYEYFQMWIVSQNIYMDMDRSKQRIFEILIFIDSLLVIPLNVLNVLPLTFSY